MNFQCPKCNSTIPADDPIRLAAAPVKMDVPLPAKLTLERSGSDVSIRLSWRNPRMWLGLALVTIWDGTILSMWGSTDFVKSSSLMELMEKLLLIPHTAIGLALTYIIICMFVNQTMVAVSGGKLTVAHKPLPWPGNRVVPAGDVQQLYCREHSHSKHRSEITYQIFLIWRFGSAVKLIGHIEELDQALFIEQELERALGITDRSIRGELKR